MPQTKNQWALMHVHLDNHVSVHLEKTRLSVESMWILPVSLLRTKYRIVCGKLMTIQEEERGGAWRNHRAVLLDTELLPELEPLELRSS